MGDKSDNTKNTEEWRKMGDTRKMSPDEVKRAGTPSGLNPGEVLHQRRKLPYSLTTMTMVGAAITGAVMYFTLYVKKKPEVSALEVAKVTTGLGTKEDTHPPK